MALQQFIYAHAGCPLASCEQGKFELQANENVKITLEPKNPDWTLEFKAEIISVEKTATGRNYLIEYDDVVLGAGGVIFEGCDIDSIVPFCCCDELDERVTALENTGNSYTFNPDGTVSDNNGGTQTVTAGAIADDAILGTFGDQPVNI